MAIYVRKMDKYKHLLLWSTLLLSFFQVTNVQAAEERNPIYNPTNPTEEIYPIENTGTPEKMEETNESTITSETQAEESSEDVSKKEVTTNNPKTNEERPSSKKVSIKYFSRMNYLMLAISPLYQIAQAVLERRGKTLFT